MEEMLELTVVVKSTVPLNPMVFNLELLSFLLGRNFCLHVVSVPAQSEVLLLRVHQQVEEL